MGIKLTVTILESVWVRGTGKINKLTTWKKSWMKKRETLLLSSLP